MALPPLRQELALYDGPRLSDGQPSWTLHDPVRNQFFRIDWLTFEIIARWDMADQQAVAQAISRETTLQVTPGDVDEVLRFLADKQLLRPTAHDSSARFAKALHSVRGSWRARLLHQYLFFRIPLVRPDAWLQRWQGWVAPLYSRRFAYLTLAALLLGCVEVYRDWARFSATLVDTFSWGGLLAYGAALVTIKVLHELGHAFTAKRFGCRVPVMGVAFLVMFPVAYTDTTDVWKLSQRHQRLAVAAAGVSTEVIIAAWALLAWGFLPEGLLKSIAFTLATTSLAATLLVNSSPFMRFDGYFLLSDWLDMPNLHERAFAMALWDLRERLFKLEAPPPEDFPRHERLGLIAFAYATWVYRLLVFVAIALLVYTFFIKVVGVLLFIVEIAWFVARPVWNEVKRWPALLSTPGQPGGFMAQLQGRPRLRRSVFLALALLVLFVIPWPMRQGASGTLKPVDTYPLYAPAAAQVVALPVKEGSAVKEGELLLELASPELQLRWQRARARLERLRWQSGVAGVSQDQRQNLQLWAQELATAEAELASVQADMALYAPKAPFAGLVRDLQPGLRPGTWVSARERLGMVVAAERWQVETYLDEDAVNRIKVGDQGQFFSDGLEGPALPLVVTGIDRDASRSLPNAQLAAQVGGSIMTRQKQGQLVPDRAVYRVILSVNGDVQDLAQHSWRGRVVIVGSWEAPGLIFLRHVMAVLWRELGM